MSERVVGRKIVTREIIDFTEFPDSALGIVAEQGDRYQWPNLVFLPEELQRADMYRLGQEAMAVREARKVGLDGVRKGEDPNFGVAVVGLPGQVRMLGVFNEMTARGIDGPRISRTVSFPTENENPTREEVIAVFQGGRRL